MFDFLRNGGFGGNIANSEAARNMYQPQHTQEQHQLEALNKQVQDIQKIIDTVCKIYVAEHAKEIANRDPDERWFKTDQPIIDHANLLDLQHKIMVAEMELKELKRRRGL